MQIFLATTKGINKVEEIFFFNLSQYQNISYGIRSPVLETLSKKLRTKMDFYKYHFQSTGQCCSFLLFPHKILLIRNQLIFSVSSHFKFFFKLAFFLLVRFLLELLVRECFTFSSISKTGCAAVSNISNITSSLFVFCSALFQHICHVLWFSILAFKYVCPSDYVTDLYSSS